LEPRCQSSQPPFPKHVLNRCSELSHLNWLGDIAVHPRREALLCINPTRLRGHRNDWAMLAVVFSRPRIALVVLVTIHIRLSNAHQDNIESLFSRAATASLQLSHNRGIPCLSGIRTATS